MGEAYHNIRNNSTTSILEVVLKNKCVFHFTTRYIHIRILVTLLGNSLAPGLVKKIYSFLRKRKPHSGPLGFVQRVNDRQQSTRRRISLIASMYVEYETELDILPFYLDESQEQTTVTGKLSLSLVGRDACLLQINARTALKLALPAVLFLYPSIVCITP